MTVIKQDNNYNTNKIDCLQKRPQISDGSIYRNYRDIPLSAISYRVGIFNILSFDLLRMKYQSFFDNSAYFFCLLAVGTVKD